MPTQQCHDNTIGCDSRFRSNITLADANPPGSRVNNTPFRHQVDGQECLQPPDPASHHIAARNEISSQLVWEAPLRASQQCHDNTIGCDSRFRSNIILADANLPISRVNNTPFRHPVDGQGCVQPPDPASHHIAARNEISSQLVWSTSESLTAVSR